MLSTCRDRSTAVGRDVDLRALASSTVLYIRLGRLRCQSTGIETSPTEYRIGKNRGISHTKKTLVTSFIMIVAFGTLLAAQLMSADFRVVTLIILFKVPSEQLFTSICL